MTVVELGIVTEMTSLFILYFKMIPMMSQMKLVSEPLSAEDRICEI